MHCRLYAGCQSIQGYKQQKAFIVTQGPMKSTCRDFWKMVYDKKCGTVVALSELMENGTVTQLHMFAPGVYRCRISGTLCLQISAH